MPPLAYTGARIALCTCRSPTLRVTSCMVHVAHCLLRAVCYDSSVACRSLHVVRCMPSVACRPLHAVRCMPSVACRRAPHTCRRAAAPVGCATALDLEGAAGQAWPLGPTRSQHKNWLRTAMNVLADGRATHGAPKASDPPCVLTGKALGSFSMRSARRVCSSTRRNTPHAIPPHVN